MMEIVSISDAVDDRTFIAINGYTRKLDIPREGTLRFEPHEQDKIENFMTKIGMVSFDDETTLTGFFVRSYMYEYNEDEGYVGTAEFSFSGLGDRLDFL